MSAMASLDDAETEESKSERKRNALWLIPGSIIFYYYWVPPEKCPFRRPRLTWADKQKIIKNSAILAESKKSEKFIKPDFVEPENFITLKEDLETLKTRLYNETMERNPYKVNLPLMPSKFAIPGDIEEMWDAK